MTATIELTTISCGCCGGTYAINEKYRERAHQEGTSWTCPYCKTGWGYTGDSENSKLKKQLAAQEEALRAREQSLAAARAREANALEEAAHFRRSRDRLARRAKAGTCPCCQRTVSQMTRHMKTKHPDWKPA